MNVSLSDPLASVCRVMPAHTAITAQHPVLAPPLTTFSTTTSRQLRLATTEPRGEIAAVEIARRRKGGVS